MFWNEGEEEKGTLGIHVTSMPDGIAVCEGVDGLATRPVGDIEVDEPKFNETTSAIYMIGLGALTTEGETPLAIEAKLGVETSTTPSPELDITTLKGTPTRGGPNGRTCTKTGPLS